MAELLRSLHILIPRSLKEKVGLVVYGIYGISIGNIDQRPK